MKSDEVKRGGVGSRISRASRNKREEREEYGGREGTTSEK
jgi:hypothetical protein